MRQCDVDDRIGISLLVFGLVVGAGITLFISAVNNKSKSFESRIATLESATEKNADDAKQAYRLASQAVENSIKAHQRINRVNVEIGSDEEPR